MVTLDTLQVCWQHSSEKIGIFFIEGSNAFDSNGRLLDSIAKKSGYLAMSGFIASTRKSTPMRVVWQCGRLHVYWYRVTQVSGQSHNEREEKNKGESSKRSKNEGRACAKRKSTASSGVLAPSKVLNKAATHAASPKKRMRKAEDSAISNPDETTAFPVLPDQYAKFYTMIAGENELPPIEDVDGTLQEKLEGLHKDSLDRVRGFLGHDPRNDTAKIQFSSFEPLKQHVVKRVIEAESEGKPLFRWAPGFSPLDAAANERCMLEEDPENLRKACFFNAPSMWEPCM